MSVCNHWAQDLAVIGCVLCLCGPCQPQRGAHSAHSLSVSTPPRPGRPQRVHHCMQTSVVQSCTKFHARARRGSCRVACQGITLQLSGLTGQVIGLSVFLNSWLFTACPRPKKPGTPWHECMQSLGTRFGRHRLCAVPLWPMPAPTWCTLCTTLSVSTPPRPGRPQEACHCMHTCVVQPCTKFHVRARRG